MKKKKIPVRMCVACRQGRPKKELIRIVKAEDGELYADTTGKANGRGAYICPDIACLEKAVKQKSLERALGAKLTAPAVNNIKRVIMRRGL